MIGYNVQLALHGLRRFPKSTLLVVLTVALGLSACMTTLVLLHVLTADPLPGRSQHLYLTWVDTVLAKPDNGASADMALNGFASTPNAYRRIKLADAQALLSSRRAVAQALVADMVSDETSDDGKRSESSQVILATSADFVPMFGVALRYGRNWSAAEEAARLPVTLIDTELAQRLFGRVNAVGRSVRLKNTLFRVIGVFEPYAPEPHFFALYEHAFSGDGEENLYVPYLAALDAGLRPSSSDICDAPAAGAKESTDLTDPARCASLNVWAQLDTPQQVADYREYLSHYVGQPKALAAFGKQPQAQLFRLDEWLKLQNVVPQSVRLNVWLATSFLLLCMFNVSGMLAARFLHRSAEIGVRRALGAPRRSVFIQHVLEGGAVCLIGGVLALPLTLLGLWLLRRQVSEFSGLARIDPLMFGALFTLALLVGLLVGALPAWRASAVQPGLQIKSD